MLGANLRLYLPVVAGRLPTDAALSLGERDFPVLVTLQLRAKSLISEC